MSPNGSNSTGTSTWAGDMVVPISCTVDALYVFGLSTSVTAQAQVTLFKNDVQTLIGCTDSLSPEVNSFCNDPNGATTHAVSVNAGDVISVNVDWVGGTVPTGRIGVSVHCH